MLKHALGLATATVLALGAGACHDGPDPLAPADPSFHVGYRGPEAPLGFVTNDAECHIGKRGARWPAAEQYEVKTFDAQLVVTPEGGMTLVCRGDIPADRPWPSQAEVHAAVLCFLPNGVTTRHAWEVFTPGGKIVLTCHYNPHRG
jgi:hypothetical protein